MKITTKKGAAIVESAIVLPIVLLTIIMVLSVAVNFYEDVKIQVMSHVKTREAMMVDDKISKGEGEFIRNLDFIKEGESGEQQTE
ncbi:MAG: pilus assembly protein [Eubacteriales bacterium]|nr:pilus assembly protein [Eubacteriales bacterium]